MDTLIFSMGEPGLWVTDTLFVGLVVLVVWFALRTIWAIGLLLGWGCGKKRPGSVASDLCIRWIVAGIRLVLVVCFVVVLWRLGCSMYLSFNTVEINGDSVRLNYDWGNRQFPLSSIKYAGSAPGEDKPPVRGRYETLVLEIRTVDGSVYRSQKISACDWDAPRYVIDEFNEFCRKKRIHRVPIPVQRRNCTRNLREIGLELREYADLHKNQYPASGNSSDEIFRSLGDYLQEEGWLRCPSEGGKSRQSYCYAIPNPNLFTNSTAIPENFPLAMDRGLSPTNVALSALVGKKWSESSPHGGKGGNVLFAGGHVKWCLEFDSTFDTNGFLLVPR